MKSLSLRAAGLLVFATPFLPSTLPAQNTTALNTEVKREYRRWLNCDIDRLSSESETGPDFSIRLSYRESPLSGYRITVVSNSGELVAADQTDAQGIARFVGIPAGRYVTSVDGLAGPRTEIRVKASIRPGRNVGLEWPADVAVVRKVQGRLGRSENDVVSPFQFASLEVLDLRTAFPVASALTDSDGHYLFSTVMPGLYVLRVSFPAQKGMEAATHDIPVEVNSEADDEELPAIKFERSECDVSASEWADPDRVLFDRAMKAINSKQFAVARLTLQTLINTYPESKYANKAKRLLKEQKAGSCENVWSSPPCSEVCSGILE